MDLTDKVIDSAGSSILWPDQVRALILAARRAWVVQRGLGLADDDFDTWRKGALWDAVQVASFRLVGQRQYGVALGYFAGLAGREAPASAVREKSGEGDRRRAQFVLKRECERIDGEGLLGAAGSAARYAATLFDRIHKVSLEKASARQIWQVVFTLRSRVARKRT